MTPRLLRIASAAEVITLVLMLANIATAHVPEISSLLGPAHGCAYLIVVVGTIRHAGADGRAKLLAILPGVGGLLALRRIAHRHAH
ncbi:DUF3817 domain-containing protein [Microtetraspora niveoalba]|uniref:DUF3817 domain-containing protein n=1 Tax=Microtetraspora niveoalba TaxID=46175 RepID=UPI000835E270|nr:DUF3817 domain-containing protein [Microtetraspora niveoalba]